MRGPERDDAAGVEGVGVVGGIEQHRRDVEGRPGELSRRIVGKGGVV